MPVSPYTLTALDANGVVVGTYDNSLTLRAGEERWVVISVFRASPAPATVQFQIRRNKPFRPAMKYPAPTLTISQATLQPNARGDGSTQTGQVKNETKTIDVPQVEVSSVFFDAAGKLITADSTYISNLKADQTASFKLTGPTQTPADTKTYATPQLIDGLY